MSRTGAKSSSPGAVLHAAFQGQEVVAADALSS